MKIRLFFTVFSAAVLTLASARAQFTWNGQSSFSNPIVLNGNWAGGTAPTGSGSENVTFGDITSGPAASDPSHTVYLPVAIAVNNILFNGGSNRPQYLFTGSGQDLTLNGNLTVQSGANVTFDNSVTLNLSNRAHTVSISSGVTVYVGGEFEPSGGSIAKTGSGTLEFNDSANYKGALTATSGTVSLGTLVREGGNQIESAWTFNNSSVLKVTDWTAGLVSGTFYFNDSSKLSGQSSGVVSSGSEAHLYFGDNSSFQASASGLELDGDGVIAGGRMDFSGHALLKAGVANSISGGRQRFSDNAILTASGAHAITGGIQIFGHGSDTDSSLTRLVVNQSGSIDGGVQIFKGYSSLQANNQNGGSITGGVQIFKDNSYLRASYENSISGGHQTFKGWSHLDANATHAVGETEITLKGESAINLGANNALSSSTEIYFSGADGGTGGFLHLNGFSTTVGEIASGSSEGSGYIYNGAVPDATLTVSNAEDSTFSGFITNGSEDGKLALVKEGAGTLTLSGNYSDYSGGTTINQGVVVAAGYDSLGTGTVNVNSSGVLRLTGQTYTDIQVNNGGTLTGTGFASSASINQGGLISPGGVYCPIGTLSFNDLTLNPNGGLVWNFKDPNNYDQVSVIYATTLAINATNAGGEFTIYVSSLNSDDNPGMATGFLAGQPYDFYIFSAHNITDFEPDKFKFDTTGFSTDAGSNATFSIRKVVDGSDQYLVLSFTPVPEPSTWALLGTGVLAVGMMSWRKRKRA